MMKKQYMLIQYTYVNEGKYYNLPKSYHFYRIQYKDAIALESEKIHFENLSCVSDLIAKMMMMQRMKLNNC